MNIESEEIKRRMARFEAVCRESGLKLTHQRLEIFREVAGTGDHPDAETVFRGVRRRMPTVSLDTVYRTLWFLNDLGLITTLGPPRERTRFDANLSSHHHFVCVKCGMIRDFYSEELDRIKIPDSVTDFGSIDGTHVEVSGLCNECVKNTDNQPKKEHAP